MKKLSVKAVLSTLLILVFLCLAFTGALLYFGRTGMVLGFSRHMLRETHFWVAASMCVLIPVHLILNLRIYRAEVRALRGGKRRNSQFIIHNSQLSGEEIADRELGDEGRHESLDKDME